MSGRHRAADRPPAGEVAVVTGASGGIGRALAVGLGGAGMSVALIGRNRTRLDAALRETVATGARAVAFAADVTVREDVEAAVEAVERDLGPIDLLVNNAGRIERAEVPVWEADPAEWWAVVESSLRGSFLMARYALPGMVARGGGRVVDISSGIATDRSPVYSGYAAAKAGLVRLTGSIAAAGAPHGVRAFDVAPGVVRTAMTEAMALHAARTEWTDVSEVVDLVVAIASGDLDALSGRWMRAGTDSLEDLHAWGGWISESGARTVGLRPYGPDDPLA